MIVVEKYDDGTQSEILEGGDRVRVIDPNDRWILEKGEMATIVEVEKEPSIISTIGIRTDEMVKGNWGVSTVHPWHIEFVEKEDKRKLPKQIREYIKSVRKRFNRK